MNISRIKKKYPYKEAKATVIKIIRCIPKEGFVTAYDKYDAIDDLISDERRYGFSTVRTGLYDYSRYEIYDKVSSYAHDHCGLAVIEEDFNGDPVAKVFEHWYDQELLVEYEDLNGNKHRGKIDISSETKYRSGDQAKVCYLIDDPDKVNIKRCGYKTIEDYMVKRFFTILIVSIILIFTLIMAVYYGYWTSLI